MGFVSYSPWPPSGSSSIFVQGGSGDDHHHDTHVSIVLGILIGLLASCVQSLGLTIQRKSHVLNQALPPSEQKLEHRRPLWLLGFAIFLSSNILGSLVQIASLPVVILAPLGAVSLLWNALFARLLLGDLFSPFMILGTLLIAGGAVLIACFGVVPEPTRSLEDLLRLFRRPAFVAYFSTLGVVVGICIVGTHLLEYRLRRQLVPVVAADFSPPMSPRSPVGTLSNPSALSTGVTDTLATERTPLLDRKPPIVTMPLTSSPSPSRVPSPPRSRSPSPTHLAVPSRALQRTRLLLAGAYAAYSGLLSGMCLLFAKSGVELLVLTLVRGENQFWRWQAWVLVGALVVFALLQLWYMHKALVLADPTLVCPSAFCFYNISSILNGLVYFDQFSLLPPLHLGLVVLGMGVLLAGVWVVSVHAGGGGVDLAAWPPHAEEDEGAEAEGVEGEEHMGMDAEEGEGAVVVVVGHPDDEFGMTEWEEGRGRTRAAVLRGERQAVSDSAVPVLSLTSPTPPATTPSDTLQRPRIRPRPNTITAFPFSFRRTSTRVSSPGPSSPSATLTSPSATLASPSPPPARTSFSPLSPSLSASSTSTATRRRSRAHGEPPAYAHGLAFSPPPLGGGLAIGLSPLSPGFGPHPRARGRRVSGGLGAGGGDGRRRTVSEGAMSDAGWAGDVEGGGLGLGLGLGLGGAEGQPGARVEGAGEPGKTRERSVGWSRLSGLRWLWARRRKEANN